MPPLSGLGCDMAWIESHQTLWRHPKTQKAARLAAVNLHEMIGLLHCLWWWSLDYAEDGDLDAFDPADVEAAVGWTGEMGALWGAWVQAGFIEETDAGATIHDWDVYIGRLLEKRAESRHRAQVSRERARTVRAPKNDSARTDTHGARSVHPYNQPTNQPTNPHAAQPENAPESPQAAAADLSDFALVEQAHGQFIGARMGLAQAQTYEQWLKLTSPQAIIDALSEAARSANRNGGRYKYALAILNRQKEDRTLPMPARPPEMDVIDLPPEMTAPMPWL